MRTEAAMTALIDAATAEFRRRYPRRSVDTATAWNQICAIARQSTRH
jgi:hypothetical protein